MPIGFQRSDIRISQARERHQIRMLLPFRNSQIHRIPKLTVSQAGAGTQFEIQITSLKVNPCGRLTLGIITLSAVISLAHPPHRFPQLQPGGKIVDCGSTRRSVSGLSYLPKSSHGAAAGKALKPAHSWGIRPRAGFKPSSTVVVCYRPPVSRHPPSGGSVSALISRNGLRFMKNSETASGSRSLHGDTSSWRPTLRIFLVRSITSVLFLGHYTVH